MQMNKVYFHSSRGNEGATLFISKDLQLASKLVETSILRGYSELNLSFLFNVDHFFIFFHHCETLILDQLWSRREFLFENDAVYQRYEIELFLLQILQIA